MTNKKYTLAQTTGDNPLTIIYLEGFESSINKFEHPWLLAIEAYTSHEEPGGISPTESKAFDELDDLIDQRIASKTEGIRALRVKGDSMMKLYFYVHDGDKAADALDELITGKVYDREFEYKIIRDPEWQEIFALEPAFKEIIESEK